MISTLTCVAVRCDHCQRPGIDESLHFDSYDDAAAVLTGWRLRRDGHALCAVCVQDQECAVRGHLYVDEWRRCGCQGRLPDHFAAATVDAIVTRRCPLEFRSCQRSENHTDERRTATTGGA